MPWEVWGAGTAQEIRGRALCDIDGKAKVGVGLVELGPGCDTRPAHYHPLEEEHLYALAGSATLHLGDEQHVLTPGMYVRFPAGRAVPHHIENTSEAPFRYLMVGERIDADEVVYPDGAE